MSWNLVKLGDFLKVRGNRFKPNDKAISDLKRIDKIDFSGKIFISDKPSNTDMILIKNGDLVISGINVEKGAMAVYTGDEDVTATIHYSSYSFSENEIDIDFLKYFLKSVEFRNALKEQVPGGIKTEIKPKHLLPLLVEIPTDIKDQKAVVKILQNRNSKVDAISTELNHQLTLVKKLRQQLLQDAVQGRFDFAQRPSGEETGAELLKRIKAEKATLRQTQGTNKKEKELPPIKAEEIPFDIPEDWVWCRLGEIISFGPSNGFSPQESKKGTGIKCLTLTATTSGIFKSQFYKLVDVFIPEDSYLWLESGDILIQRGNSIDYVGIAALYEGVPNEYIYPDLMIKIKLPKLIDTKFIHQVLISPFSRKYFSTNAFGAQKSMPKINQGVVLNTLIPVPPLSLQHRIVQKLDELMQNCDALEASIKDSASQNEKLLQQVLREALRKEVVAI